MSPRPAPRWSDFSFQHRKMNSNVRVLIGKMSLSEGWGSLLGQNRFRYGLGG